MSQDTRAPTLDHTRLDEDDQDPEDSLPPSYEEAISHIEEDSSGAAVAHRQLRPQQHQHQQHHQHSQSGSSAASRPFSLNDEIQNSDGDEDDARAHSESSPLWHAQVPNSHMQSTHIQPTTSSTSSGGNSHHQHHQHHRDPFSNSHHNPFGDQHHDPFHKHQHHRHHHGRPHRREHSNPSFDTSIVEPSAPPAVLTSADSTTATSQSATATTSSPSTPSPFPPGVPFPAFPNRPFPPGFTPPVMPGPLFAGSGGFGSHPGGFSPLDQFGPPVGFGFGSPGAFGGFPPFRPGHVPFVGPSPPTFSFRPPQPPAPPGPLTLANPSVESPALSISEKQFKFESGSETNGSQVTPPLPAAAAAAAALVATPSAPQAPPSALSSSSSTAPAAAPPAVPIPTLSSIPATAREGISTSATSSSSFIPPTSSPMPLTGISNAPGLMSAVDISSASFTRSKRGVETQDPLLDDPFQLYRFFVAHNDRPSMHLLITGSHMEKRTSEERDSNGYTKVVQEKVKVHDFKMDFDLSPYISPTGTLMTLPDPKTGQQPTLRQVMEEHVEEENPFKELHMEKKVAWEYEYLIRTITHAIRSVNYRYTIEISFPINNNRVVVDSTSPVANFLRSKWTKAFCAISLVGIAIYPLRQMYRKVKDKSLQSEFQMTIKADEFYMANYWNIIDQVQYKQ